MIKQIQDIIDLFLLIDGCVKKRPFSLACMDEINERFESLQYDLYELAKVLQKGFLDNSWIEIKICLFRVTSQLSNINELTSQVLGKKRFQTYENDQQVQILAKQGAKEDIIKLLARSLVFIKKEFKREGDLPRRLCELKRAEKEIKTLKSVLCDFEKYLIFVHKNIPKTRQEIRQFLQVIYLFLTQIECHIYFIVWITKFWVITCWMNIRFLQLHDE